MKCNDSVYGKVLQLLTLAVYVTQDLQAMAAAGEGRLICFCCLIVCFIDCFDRLAIGCDLLYNWRVFITLFLLLFYFYTFTGSATGAAAALSTFMLETPYLPTSESAFSMYMTTTTTDTTLLPCLLHVLLDIYYANDPLDVNSKHWVLWLVEQVVLLDPLCKDNVETYKTIHNLVPVSTDTKPAATTNVDTACAAKLNTAQSKAMSAMQAQADKFKAMFGDISDSEEEDEDSDSDVPVTKPATNTTSADVKDTTAETSATPAAPPASAPSAAQLARERALKAMQANATNFAAMMDGLSDTDSDTEDTPVKKSTPVVNDKNNVVNIGNTSSLRGKDQDSEESGDDTNIDLNKPSSSANKVSTKVSTSTHTTTATTTKHSDPSHSSSASTEEIPVCIICQADANTEGTNGNVRTLGYLALLQASTVLTHACADSTHMHMSPTLASIHSKIAPKQLSSECNTHISFCGHGKSICNIIIFYIQKFLRVWFNLLISPGSDWRTLY